ncbi:hypothetical protein [Treponema endosymbiont of Eucomonympha sp.]|uniref:hypothetical protein n=1 Tax=Treponema endosymbiont of Eucomonympha sp. TaxID=1580831 RepID=UPI0007516611|nr:hypothetical protein [Treponema endosymbiont of Eucomonympha sp.]
MSIKILDSAHKHNLSDDSRRACLAKEHAEQLLDYPPEKRLYAGFDHNGNPLEIIALIEDNTIKVIHAMKLRNASRESPLKPARRFYKRGML